MWQHVLHGFYQTYTLYETALDHIKPRLLYYSSHLFLLPIAYYAFAIPTKTRYLTTIFTMVFTNFVFSLAFWSDPTKHTIIHYIDRTAAKASIVTIATTTIAKRAIMGRPMGLFLGSLGVMVLFFYLSNLFSAMDWCSKPHLTTHFMGHIMATITMFFLFG